MMFAWLDTHKLKGPESFRAWRLAQEELRNMQARSGNEWPVALPVGLDSPLLPFTERMGYVRPGGLPVAFTRKVNLCACGPLKLVTS